MPMGSKLMGLNSGGGGGGLRMRFWGLIFV